jgi:DnaJ-class molecular chaperone
LDDPYATLGLAKDASADAIRKAYRKLAKQHHPDLNPGDAQAEERFKAISAAHALLSDPEKRAQFDRGEIDASGEPSRAWRSYRDHAEGTAGRRYSRASSAEGWDADDLGDLFGSMFGGGRSAGGEVKLRGRDEFYSLSVAFLDAVNGATRRLTLPDGKTLDVKIPVGVEDGQTLRLKGEGGPGWNGGPSGDALVQLTVEPHPYFTREGDDIRLELPVSLKEAVLGGPVEAPTPGGRVRVRVPAGSDSGAELRLRGRGVPARQGRPAGDLYAVLRVKIGKPDPKLEAFLREWTPEHEMNPRETMEARS